MIREADVNGNGTIDFEEFCAHMAKLTLDGAGADGGGGGGAGAGAGGGGGVLGWLRRSAARLSGRAPPAPAPPLAQLATRRSQREITATEVSEFRAVFEKIDADSTGTIDEGELYRAMRSSNLRVSKAEVATMFAEADADGNGEIDLTEFLELMASKSDATATNWWAGWLRKRTRADLTPEQVLFLSLIHI